MAGQRQQRSDVLNLAAVLAAGAAARFFPLDLLFVSYAFLGPLHYGTQIAWMHERHYFTRFRAAPWLLTALGCVYLAGDQYRAELATLMTVVVAAVASFRLGAQARWLWLCLGFVVVVVFWSIAGETSALMALLLPTVIHVFVFTFAFMVAGFTKTRTRLGALTLVFFALMAMSFWVWPTSAEKPLLQMSAEGMVFFQPVADTLAAFSSLVFGRDANAFFGFLSFAYTFHYMNWFAKTEIIGWHRAGVDRLCLVGAAYVAAIALYLVDFQLGFLVLLAFSLLHVLLELPLNVQTFARLLGYVSPPATPAAPKGQAQSAPG